MLSVSLAQIVSAQDNLSLTPTPALATPVPEVGSSDSGELHNRIRFRIDRALKDTSGLNGGGYHWIFLLQVARYPDSNIRFTDMRRGVQRVIDDLVAARQGQNPAQVGDTITFVPYHFNILGTPKQWPLRDYLADPTPLKQRVPGEPLVDSYAGKRWSDGHDWRAALQQTLGWMKKRDLDTGHAVIVVLDWNDLAQAPQTLEDGTRQTTSNKFLVLPENAARYHQFLLAMRDAGLDDSRKLETVAVGNLEYDLAVFTPRDLTPIAATAASGLTPAPTPAPQSASSGAGALVPLLLFAVGAIGGAWLLFKPHRLRLSDGHNEKVEFLRLANRNSLDVLATGGQSRAGATFVLSGLNAATAPERALVTLRLQFPGKIVVTTGACDAAPISGFRTVPGGVQLNGNRGELELTLGDRPVAHLAVRRL